MCLGDNIAMLDYDDDSPEFDPTDPERVYLSYLEMCRRSRVEPAPRDRAHRLMAEWTEVLSGRPDPTQH